MSLVFGVFDMFNFRVPAASAAATFIALLGCRTVAVLINDRGPMSPGLTRGCVILRVA